MARLILIDPNCKEMTHLIANLDLKYKPMAEYDYETDRFLEIESIVKYIEEKVPKIEAEPVRHGRWVTCEHYKRGYYFIVLVCSECNTEADVYTKFRFCPWCGARMDGTV